MPMICVVYGCSSRSNREKNKSFYRVPKIVQHKGEKCKEQTKKRRDKWLANLLLSFGGAESENARVCSDHFVKGRPSALKDVDCVDWAPTVDLGYAHPYKPMSETSRLRYERMKSREGDRREGERRRSEGAEALLELREAENTEPEEPMTVDDQQDAGCQTDLTMSDIERMEDVLKQTTNELDELRTKALQTQFSQESLQKNEDKLKFYTDLPSFLVLPVFQRCDL